MEDEELEDFDNELMFKCSEDMKPNQRVISKQKFITPLINDQKLISEILTEEINNFNMSMGEAMSWNRL